jgi:CRP-like cAMP-binding protein
MPKRASTVRPPPPAQQQRPKNKLIACLPNDDYARLRPLLKTIPLKKKQIIHRRNEPVGHVIFPNGGVASVTTVMKDGAAVEIATVGDEGLIGIDAFFGNVPMTSETMMQVPDGDGEMMTADAFRREMGRPGAFQECVLRYWQGFQKLVMQSTACMALHPLQDRCCRWLLMAHDRVRRDEFELSHEFLAMMLGATRPTVTVVAGTLQKAGLIRYRHGRVTVVDRNSLEDAACECYATVRAEFERLGL